MASVAEILAAIERRKAQAREKPETHRDRAKKFYASRAWKKKRFDIIRRDSGRCHYCGQSAADGVKICVDHKIPLSKDWSLRLADDNLVVACNSCNWGKLHYPAAEIAPRDCGMDGKK